MFWEFKKHRLGAIKRRGGGFIYCCLIAAVFLKVFIFSTNLDWQEKFHFLNVPALSWPGGDSRNIQTTAYCVRHGYPYFGWNNCQRDASIVRKVYPQAFVPPLNYPTIWVKAYSFFNNDSESFFNLFWTANALLFVISVSYLAFVLNYKILPVALFSPMALLMIERGNTDGFTFFLTFLPFLILSSKRTQGFFLGFASALKLFPLFGYLAFLKKRPPFVDSNIIFGGLVALPLMLPSFMEIRDLIQGTSYTLKTFSLAFGLTSVIYDPYFSTRETLAYALIAGFAMISIAVVAWAWKNKVLRYETECDLEKLSAKELSILAVSVCIFLFIFIFFTSWAYRLIFLIPSLFVLSNAKSKALRVMYGNIIVILWLPLFPHGWVLQNLACFLLAPMALFLILLIWNRQFLNVAT